MRCVSSLKLWWVFICRFCSFLILAVHKKTGLFKTMLKIKIFMNGKPISNRAPCTIISEQKLWPMFPLFSDCSLLRGVFGMQHNVQPTFHYILRSNYSCRGFFFLNLVLSFLFLGRFYFNSLQSAISYKYLVIFLKLWQSYKIFFFPFFL